MCSAFGAAMRKKVIKRFIIEIDLGSEGGETKRKGQRV
jgi:hypothetical protein